MLRLNRRSFPICIGVLASHCSIRAMYRQKQTRRMQIMGRGGRSRDNRTFPIQLPLHSKPKSEMTWNSIPLVDVICFISIYL